MHVDAAWWTFTLFVLGDEALHILKFVRKFSAFCICFFPLNIITGWDIYVRELSLCDMNWFHFSCDNLPFWSLIIMFNFADLYTWVLILPWKSTAGRIWDLSFSQLYPFFFLVNPVLTAALNYSLIVTPWLASWLCQLFIGVAR